MALNGTVRLALYGLLVLLAAGLLLGLSVTRQRYNQRAIEAAGPLLTGDACLLDRYHKLEIAGRPKVVREGGHSILTVALTTPSGILRVRVDCEPAGGGFACRLLESLDAGGHRMDLGTCREIPAKAPLAR